MARPPNSDDTDAYVQGLQAIYDAVGREFDFHDDKALRLEKRIDELRADLEALRIEFEAERARADQFSSFGIQIEDALSAAREGEPGRTELTTSLTRMSRHGPVGIRAPILEVMAKRPRDAWSPEQVRSDLALRGIVKTGRNVGQTMRNMVAGGQLQRIGRGAYRLPDVR